MRHYFEYVWVILGGWDIILDGWSEWGCIRHYFGWWSWVEHYFGRVGVGGHSVHPPFLLAGVEPPTRFLKRGDLTGPQFLEEVAGNKSGGTFFREFAIFRQKIN